MGRKGAGEGEAYGVSEGKMPQGAGSRGGCVYGGKQTGETEGYLKLVILVHRFLNPYIRSA